MGPGGKEELTKDMTQRDDKVPDLNTRTEQHRSLRTGGRRQGLNGMRYEAGRKCRQGMGKGPFKA